ncbi:hypothetical protein TSOC_006039 [Tetrabaena socialis]|uniref:Pherophorin domain-containing protein n=1 Tax=Tetrabaena socialis TaxID=47790 RepID=A0A2J8A4R3_9CHLO|nr:hypothetical protein TSOC_006039 [Tetrabaena socialis]|eukprot:PNH07496.1 hypothetical protein TSOC_006039 [Tetrabaena socialis]
MRGLWAALGLMTFASLARASYLTGSGFPFEGCKLAATVNRWSVAMVSYNEDPVRGSRACFRFSIKSLDSCTPAGLRCCGENHLNKFKMYIALAGRPGWTPWLGGESGE